MNIIQRYIAKNVMISTALVFLIVLILSFVINLLGELRDIGQGEYGFLQAIIHVVLMQPHTIYQLFPMLVLLGGILGLGTLASGQELIVMRTSGLSVGNIAKAVFLAAIILIILASLMGELVAPRANFLADQLKSSEQSGGQAVATTSGVWIHEGNNFLHIDHVIGREHLEGVTRYEFDNQHQLLAAYFVKSVRFINHQWVLHDLIKTSFQKNKIISETIPLATWNLKLTPNYLTVGIIEPEAMTLRKLAAYSLYLRSNHLQASNFQLEFWKRLLQPLTTLVMILLAIPFVFTAPRSMSSGKRILLAILIGFAFYIVNAFVGQFSIVFQFPPILGAFIPILLFAFIGYTLMLRIKN